MEKTLYLLFYNMDFDSCIMKFRILKVSGGESKSSQTNISREKKNLISESEAGFSP